MTTSLPSRRVLAVVHTLVRHRGRIVTHEALIGAMYAHRESALEPENAQDVLQVTIAEIRKLLPPGSVMTVYGEGYMMSQATEVPPALLPPAQGPVQAPLQEVPDTALAAQLHALCDERNRLVLELARRGYACTWTREQAKQVRQYSEVECDDGKVRLFTRQSDGGLGAKLVISKARA